MLRWVLLVFCLSAPCSAYAEHPVPAGKPVELLELTQEAKRAVPSLEGASDENGVIVFRRLQGGPFTQDEQALLNQAVAAHDAGSRETKKQAERASLASAKQKLRTLGLTNAEIDALTGGR